MHQKAIPGKHHGIQGSIGGRLGLVIIIQVSARISCCEDDRKMWEGIYARFITFTTIGLGDFIPTKSGFRSNLVIIPGLCSMPGLVDALVECASRFRGVCTQGNFVRFLFCYNKCNLNHVDNVVENTEASGSAKEESRSRRKFTLGLQNY